MTSNSDSGSQSDSDDDNDWIQFCGKGQKRKKTSKNCHVKREGKGD